MNPIEQYAAIQDQIDGLSARVDSIERSAESLEKTSRESADQVREATRLIRYVRSIGDQLLTASNRLMDWVQIIQSERDLEKKRSERGS